MKLKKFLGYALVGIGATAVTVLVVRPDIREKVFEKGTDLLNSAKEKIKSNKENCECENCREEEKPEVNKNNNFQKQKPVYNNDNNNRRK